MSEVMGPFQYFFCGGFGGICTVLVGHPLDTVKVRLQTMPTPKPGEKPLYSGTLDCFKTTVVNEGVRGLYKGMSAPLLAISPIFAISFMGYGIGKRIFGPPTDQRFTYFNLFCAGAFSGIFTTIIMAPGERIKSLLQVQQHSAGPKMYEGSLDCAIKLYRQGGIRNIYKGSVATLARDIPGAGGYFLTYTAIKDYMTNYGEVPPSTAGTVVAGGFAGIANWIAGMPADVVKSRLQTAPEGVYPNGMRDVIRELAVKEGPLGFYKGLVPVLLRAFPANAACFVGFELCKRFMDSAEIFLRKTFINLF